MNTAPVVILAGGLGTRIRTITDTAGIAKALVPVGGLPFIDHKLAELRDSNVGEVWLLVGHRATGVRSHVGDGRRFGLVVRYLHDGPTLLGTGGAVRRALPHLPERFWLTYGDTLLEVPMMAVESAFSAGDDLVTMTVLRNEDQWEPSNVEVEGGHVTQYRKGAPPGTLHFIDYGLLLLRRAAFELVADIGDPFDLGQLWQRCIAQHRLAAFPVQRRFYEVGTPEGLATTEAWLDEQRP